MILGDDNAMGFKYMVDISFLYNHTRKNYNMLSDPSINKHHGVFLQMLLYKDENNVAKLGPDWVRMNRRY